MNGACRLIRRGGMMSVAGLVLLCGRAASGQTLALFTFDDATATDLSGNNVTTSLIGSPTPVFGVAGYEGSGVSVDGSNAIRVDLNINASVVPKLTMGAWVKASSDSSPRHLISQDNGGFDRDLDVDTRGGGRGWSAFKGNGVVGFVPVDIDQWQFVAAVYDGVAGTVTLYVDGVVKTGTGTNTTGNTFMYIGNSPCCDAGVVSTIDGAFVLGEALSLERLDEIRAGGIRKVPTCPLILDQPDDTIACPSNSALMSVMAAGSGSLAVRWQWLNGIGMWVDVNDGTLTGVGDLFGTDSETLIVSNLVPGAAARFRARAANGCGSVTSQDALLTVCPSDTNCDGFVNGDDYDNFASLFDAGDLGADLNQDGFVNGDDYDYFASAFEAGC